jgi:hypothetical protein
MDHPAAGEAAVTGIPVLLVVIVAQLACQYRVDAEAR